MRSPIHSFSLAISIGALTVLAGCGSSNRLTKAEFIEKGDEICTELKELEEELSLVKSFEELEELMGPAIDKTNQALEDFRDLNPPEEDEETINKFLSIGEEQLPLMEEYKKAVGEEDREKAFAIYEEVNEKEKRSDKIARDYGLKACG